MNTYPRFFELSPTDQAQSEPLWIGACAVKALQDIMPRSVIVRKEADAKQQARGSYPRSYASKYVGVTIHRNRWIAQWGPRGCVKSAVFPLTEEGELQAAYARATALGLDEPEVRG